jgi:hypothetical protein
MKSQLREYKFVSTLSLTLVLDWDGQSTPNHGTLPPGKGNIYLFYMKLGGPQGRSGLELENLAPAGVRSPDRPPVASRYTDTLCRPPPTVTCAPKFTIYISRFLEIIINKIVLSRSVTANIMYSVQKQLLFVKYNQLHVSANVSGWSRK